MVTCMLQLPYPQHQDQKQGASISSYKSISAWDTRMKVVSMVKEVREGRGRRRWWSPGCSCCPYPVPHVTG